MSQKNGNYKLKEFDGIFIIIGKEDKPLQTPDGQTFEIRYESIAKKVIEDLEKYGSDSYTNPLSALCWAFNYDKMRRNGWTIDIREELKAAPYEDDPAFMPASNGLPPARAVWNHIYANNPNRISKVRRWLEYLNPQQLMTAFMLYRGFKNMNLAYVFGELIMDEGDEGYLLDLENLYGNTWANYGMTDETIDIFFNLFEAFYSTSL